MVEQDLIISRALIELYRHETIRDTLVFRGGTALNKLFIQPPARYSEDIDLVQRRPEPIGETLDSVRAVLSPWLGEPKRKLTKRCAKLIFRYTAVDETPAKLKIEINTTEHFQVSPILHANFTVNSDWFEGQELILTYQLDELMGTKLRALYQRRKGRDLFDLWYVLDKQLINSTRVISIFEKYCQHNREPITRAMFEKNLFLKKQHMDFQSDVNALLSPNITWQFDQAIEQITQTFICQLQGEPWQGIGLL